MRTGFNQFVTGCFQNSKRVFDLSPFFCLFRPVTESHILYNEVQVNLFSSGFI